MAKYAKSFKDFARDVQTGVLRFKNMTDKQKAVLVAADLYEETQGALDEHRRWLGRAKDDHDWDTWRNELERPLEPRPMLRK